MLSKRCWTLFFIIILVTLTLFELPSTKANIVDDYWIDSIESYALNLDSETSAEIVVCVFQSLHGHGVKDSSGQEISDIIKLGVYILNDLPLEVYDGAQTGIGKTSKDNGVLILVVLDEHQWRIEVGYGLEGDITDIETNLIAQEYLVPAFQDGNYGQGLYDTVLALGNQIPPGQEPNNAPVRGYYYYETDNLPASTSPPFWEWDIFGIPLWVIVIFLLFGVFIPVFGGRRGGHRGGGRSGGGGSTGRW